MDNIQKQRILENCNAFDVNQIYKFLFHEDFNNAFTIEDFENAGLDYARIEELNQKILELKKLENSIEKEAEREKERLIREEEKEKNKQEILNKIIANKISASEIKTLIKKGELEISVIQNLDVPERTKQSLLNYIDSETAISTFKINQLPVMQLGRTDIYFIGLAGTGKTTMLTGLLKTANENGILIPDTYAGNQGINFQTTIIQNLRRGFIPPRTASGSYIYVPVSLKDKNNVSHPLNIVDVPGEIFKNISETGEAKDFLNYIKNDNKKIFFIVADSQSHHNNEGADQSLIYPNIIQILNSEGVMENTDAIYLVANKFDYLREKDYVSDDREEGDIALEYLNTEFKSLINNCLDVRENTRYKFKIKTLPYSIGKLKWGEIVEQLDKKYSETLIEIVLNDSFVIKGGANKVFN